MIELTGGNINCCDGITRRGLLRVGVLGLGGLTLPQILASRAAAAQAGHPVPKTSVIFLELAGGPTQFETYDPKPDAPAEFRGPLGTVATNLPGVYFSQLMVEQAKIADKLAIIRSIHHDSGSHRTSSHLTQTGYYLRDSQGRENEMPCVGSVVSRVRGANSSGLPGYVGILGTMRFGRAAYLGKAYNPFTVGNNPNGKRFRVDNLSLVGGLDFNRLSDRRQLLGRLDACRRVLDTQGVSEAMGKFTSQAFEMVTSDRAQQAFQIGAESDSVRNRYGRTKTGQAILLARRLIEAGVTFVSVRVPGWDDHNKIQRSMKKKGPAYDRGVAALVSDLYERGLDRDVLVVAMGEFGRTPKINRNAGRDHWGRLMSVLISGGGLRVGQVVGRSNSRGEVPIDDPYRPENVLAMVYRHLGMDPELTFPDLSGRPRYLLEQHELIRQLV